MKKVTRIQKSSELGISGSLRERLSMELSIAVSTLT
jgi:hypothetical protein